MITVIIADDHPVVRNGLRMLLESDDEIKVVGEKANGLEVLELLERCQVDLVISDLDMPKMDGVSLVREIKVRFPGVKVVILSMHDQLQRVIEVFRQGGDGYLVKNIGSRELIFAVKFVSEGQRYLCAELAIFQLDRLAQGKLHLIALKDNIELSIRELEILQLIAEGLTNMEISEQVFLSKRTIEGHRQSLLDKTSCKNSAALVRYGVQHGYIQ